MEQSGGAPPEFAAASDLTSFFADFVGPRRHGVCHGIHFDLFRAGGRTRLMRLFTRLITPGREPADDREGLYVDLLLPVSLAADLLLESKVPTREGERPADPLDQFVWSATSRERLNDVLPDRLLTLLRDQAHHRSVVMTDSKLRLGPLPNAPAQAAEELTAICSTIRAAFGHDGAAPVTGPSSFEDPVIIARTTSRVEADLYRSKLEDAGVTCLWRGYEQSPPWGSATPVREMQLYVEKANQDRVPYVLITGSA